MCTIEKWTFILCPNPKKFSKFKKKVFDTFLIYGVNNWDYQFIIKSATGAKR